MPAPSAKDLFYAAAKQTMIEFFQKTSLNGFGLLYYIRRRKYQRLLWSMFIMMGIAFACFVVSYTIYLFLDNPIVTTLDTPYYEIWNTAFPAVSICSANILSKRKVAQFLDGIAIKQNLHSEAAKKLQNNAKLLAGYFLPRFVDSEETRDFQNVLDTEGFDVAEMLPQLSPSCAELLVHCRWANQAHDCATLFQLHATVNGYCCIFNYARNVRKNESNEPELYYPLGIGPKMGLEVSLNATLADYFYTSRSFIGFLLQIFDTNIFPDASNGGVSELLVAPEQHVHVDLMLIKQETTAAARNYPVAKRQCYFADEYSSEYPLGYSQAECLTRCKLHSMQTLCGCIPFYEPIEFVDRQYSARFCTLLDALCLEHYQVTWNSYKPNDAQVPSYLKEEWQEALSCEECLPLCSYNRYECRKHSVSPRHTATNSKLASYSNHSSVNIYFPRPFAIRYEKNVVYNWYQILSGVGGVIGVCMGCSLISGFEVLYFIGFRLLENFYKLRKTASI